MNPLSLRLGIILVSVLYLLVVLSQHVVIQRVKHTESSGISFAPAAATDSSVSISSTKPSSHIFNGVALYHVDRPPVSYVSCLHRRRPLNNESWMCQSCRFENLCFDAVDHEYVLFRDARRHPGWIPADNSTLSMAIGGINPRWGDKAGFDKGIWKMKWFPRIIEASSVQSGVYMLPDAIVWVPFHSFAGHNVGHMIWDDFYAIFSLVQIFNVTSMQLFLMRYQLAYKLYATCDMRANKRKQCKANFERFLFMLDVNPETFTPSRFSVLDTKGERAKSRYVCARQGVAGLGMLTDHGMRDHGWETGREEIDRAVPHNIGRGSTFYDFRNLLVDNALGTNARQVDNLPLIAFSRNSSKDWDRRLNFTLQIDYLTSKLHQQAHVQGYTLYEMTLKEQVELAAKCQIFVTVCGGGSMTATFLPKGSTLIVYYNPVGGFDFKVYELTKRPARLDWDLLNNAGHVRVHWLPVTNMDTKEGLKVLHQLIRHELKAANP